MQIAAAIALSLNESAQEAGAGGSAGSGSSTKRASDPDEAGAGGSAGSGTKPMWPGDEASESGWGWGKKLDTTKPARSHDRDKLAEAALARHAKKARARARASAPAPARAPAPAPAHSNQTPAAGGDHSHGPQRAAFSGLWAIPSTESGSQPLLCGLPFMNYQQEETLLLTQQTLDRALAACA